MDIYQVQLWPNGRWDRQPWRKVAASNEDEAAFKATGERLSKEGHHGKIRRPRDEARRLWPAGHGLLRQLVARPVIGEVRSSKSGWPRCVHRLETKLERDTSSDLGETAKAEL